MRYILLKRLIIDVGQFTKGIKRFRLNIIRMEKADGFYKGNGVFGDTEG